MIVCPYIRRRNTGYTVIEIEPYNTVQCETTASYTASFLGLIIWFRISAPNATDCIVQPEKDRRISHASKFNEEIRFFLLEIYFLLDCSRWLKITRIIHVQIFFYYFPDDFPHIVPEFVSIIDIEFFWMHIFIWNESKQTRQFRINSNNRDVDVLTDNQS